MKRISGLRWPVQVLCVGAAALCIASGPAWAVSADRDPAAAGTGAAKSHVPGERDNPAVGYLGEPETGSGEGSGIGISSESDDGPGAQAGRGEEPPAPPVRNVEPPEQPTTPEEPQTPPERPGQPEQPQTPDRPPTPSTGDRGPAAPPAKELARTGGDSDTVVALGAAGTGVTLLGVAGVLHARRRRS
ncbi:hypothetical protein SRB5_22300 [Streptomyces sp. RB5]|uniref:Gram-positive cocci surface proteins LPxTG domain-containing protein n=1 Tax=Streptomyces smaragdinus TaxID=2585196 RepID=A0A7K0CF56_9ACTN|nr:LPXTG cell wall anchor domain-containing protein [Streptomyces smaragdinus]MQY12100.1 hypothetical protein [Streptomyces smaragdinus]